MTFDTLRHAPKRIALYSHDTCGLGHMRRNLLIAQTLVAAFPGVDILMLTGAREATAFHLPAGVDTLALPAFHKVEGGAYKPRGFNLDLEDLVSFRSSTLRTALQSFRPDVLIVDKVPRGTMGELEEALAYLKSKTHTRIVLGLRDVLDEPEVVAREWEKEDNFRAVRAYYDAVWVYGDAYVYPADEIYGFPSEMVDRLMYTGYLDPKVRWAADGDRRPENDPKLPDGPFYLCAVGGGQDGFRLAELFAQATFPEGVTGLIITGPHMPKPAMDRLEAICQDRPHVRIERFHAEPTLLYQRAERIVSMGGYNTIMELISMGKRPLVLPRIEPRREQMIRAEAFGRRGLLDVLDPLTAMPDTISAWFSSEALPVPVVHDVLDMNGLDRLPRLVTDLLTPSHSNPLISTEVLHV
ncbi:MAG: hypothetical protein R2834_24195 [Rhodothermales bacterium]